MSFMASLAHSSTSQKGLLLLFNQNDITKAARMGKWIFVKAKDLKKTLLSMRTCFHLNFKSIIQEVLPHALLFWSTAVVQSISNV